MDNFNLKQYLAEGKLHKEEEVNEFTSDKARRGQVQIKGVYELTTYQVEYDNGKEGYMFQLTDEDGNENDLDLDQIYFDNLGKKMEFGVDFDEADLLGSQSKLVTRNEAIKVFRDLNKKK